MENRFSIGIGEKVRIFGFEGKKKALNGRKGVVKGFSEDNRVVVNLKVKSKTWRVKLEPENVKALWIGLDVFFPACTPAQILTMREIYESWGMVISELTSYIEEVFDALQARYGDPDSHRHMKYEKTLFAYDFADYQDLFDDRVWPLQEKADLFRSEKDISRFTTHLLESTFPCTVSSDISSMLYHKTPWDDIMNLLDCKSCKAMTHPNNLWMWEAIRKQVKFYQAATDILFTPSLEELYFKYDDWKAEWRFNLYKFGKMWEALFNKEFIHVKCPKDGNTASAALSEFRLLLDRAMNTMVFAESRGMSAFQLFEADPDGRPSLFDVEMAIRIVSLKQDAENLKSTEGHLMEFGAENKLKERDRTTEPVAGFWSSLNDFGVRHMPLVFPYLQ